MFGANKNLRDLGKDNTDYTNYDSASNKVKMYRQQVYGDSNTVNRNTNKKSSNAGKASVIIAFAMASFFVLYAVSSFDAFFHRDYFPSEYEQNYTYEDEEIDYEEIKKENEEKYKLYDEEWVKDYFLKLNDELSAYKGYGLSIIDVDFDGVPEIFFQYEKNDNGTLTRKSYMYYYFNDIIIGNDVPFGLEMRIYKDTFTNELFWAGLDKNNSYGENIVLYRFDRINYGIGYYRDHDIRTKEVFETRYSKNSIIWQPCLVSEYDTFSGIYYLLVDEYLANQTK